MGVLLFINRHDRRVVHVEGGLLDVGSLLNHRGLTRTLCGVGEIHLMMHARVLCVNVVVLVVNPSLGTRCVAGGVNHLEYGLTNVCGRS